MPFCIFCLTAPLCHFLSVDLYRALLKSQNCPHKFSRRLLCHFSRPSALHELCPYLKLLERLRVCSHARLKSSPSWEVTHCSACILPTTALYHCSKWPRHNSQPVGIWHLLFLGVNSEEMDLPSFPAFMRLQENRQHFAPCLTSKTVFLPQVQGTVTECSIWQKAHHSTQQVYGVWRWHWHTSQARSALWLLNKNAATSVVAFNILY